MNKIPASQKFMKRKPHRCDHWNICKDECLHKKPHSLKPSCKDDECDYPKAKCTPTTYRPKIKDCPNEQSSDVHFNFNHQILDSTYLWEV